MLQFFDQMVNFNLPNSHEINEKYILFMFVGQMPLEDVICEYLRLCVEYDNSPTNSKYCVQMMLRELQESPRGKKFLECQTLEDIW